MEWGTASPATYDAFSRWQTHSLNHLPFDFISNITSEPFLPSLNIHITSAEAECVSADGSDCSLGSRGSSCRYQPPESKRATLSFIPSLTPQSSKRHTVDVLLQYGFSTSAASAVSQLAAGWLLRQEFSTLLLHFPPQTAAGQGCSAPSLPGADTSATRPGLHKPLLPLDLKVE